MTTWAKPWNAPETVETAPVEKTVTVPAAEPVAEEPKKPAKKAADTPAE